MASSNITLRLLIHAKSETVLFAEAGKDFVDFLFYLMALPIGTVFNLLKKNGMLENNGMVGCLSDLYESIENLSDTYMLTTQIKDSLLKPKSSPVPAEFPLLLTGVDSKRPKLYRSSKSHYCGSGHNSCICVTDVSGTDCGCGGGGGPLSREALYVGGNGAGAGAGVRSCSFAGGFVNGVVTYMVLNDLAVQPMSAISSIALLTKFNVKDVGSLREKVVNFGMTEALKLLKTSFQSKTVLTDVFLKNA